MLPGSGGGQTKTLGCNLRFCVAIISAGATHTDSHAEMFLFETFVLNHCLCFLLQSFIRQSASICSHSVVMSQSAQTINKGVPVREVVGDGMLGCCIMITD